MTKWILFWLVGSFVFATSAVSPHCPTELAAPATRQRINDPSSLPARQKTLVGYFGVLNTNQALEPLTLAPLDRTDLGILTSLIPVTPASVLDAYSKGWKLYQHFDVEGAGHEWQNPAFRGVLPFEDAHSVFSHSNFLKGLRKLTYSDGKPMYDIRFNHDPRRVLAACAKAERAMQNTVTKERYLDERGRTLRWNKTWLTSEIREAFISLIEQGDGYTVEVFTNANHPFHDPASSDGHLVAGAFGIVVNGVYTGISMFMDRTPHPLRPNRVQFDGAGKLAFFAEIDALEMIGVRWMDTVTVNALPREVGAYFIPRSEFLDWIDREAKSPVRFQPPTAPYAPRFDYWMR